MTTSRRIRLVVLFLVLVCTVGCDQTAKHLARTGLGESGSISFPGGFGELRLAENPGSFLSLGAAFPQSLRMAVFTVGVGVGLAVLLVYLIDRARLSRLAFLGLALVLAGGASNLIDRITRQGCVTDFIFLRVGPLHTGVFNVADMLIMVGIGAVAYALWKPQNTIEQRENL